MMPVHALQGWPELTLQGLDVVALQFAIVSWAEPGLTAPV